MAFFRCMMQRSLPTGYTRVDYIESSGTQYIDTGVNPTNNTWIKAKFALALDYSGQTNSHYLFGSRGSSSGNNYNMFNISLTAGGLLQFGYGTAYSSSAFSPNLNTVEVDCNSNVMTVRCNGESYTTTANVSQFSGIYSLYICGLNSKGTLYNAAAVRLYSCKIYDNGTIIRDFVPCKNASGVAGLYDKANGKFYTNAGTGAFVAGT